MRKLLLTLFILAFGNPSWAATVVAVWTSGTFVVPANFSSLVSLECVAAGGNGSTMGAGGGGAYSIKTGGIALSPGSPVTVQYGVAGGTVGTSSSPGTADCFFFNAASILYAQGGGATGVGGSAASGVGDTKFSGGSSIVGGGGGAAGPNGNGNNDDGSGDGGSGDNGSGGAGGSAPSGGSGGAGAEWHYTLLNGSSSSGAIGSGGGGGANFGGVGGAGGNFGAGGAAGSTSGGNGTNGFIVMTYNTAAAKAACTNHMSLLGAGC